MPSGNFKGRLWAHFLLLLLHPSLSADSYRYPLTQSCLHKTTRLPQNGSLPTCPVHVAPRSSFGAKVQSESLHVLFVLYYHSLVPFCIRLTSSLHSFESQYLLNVYCVLGLKRQKKNKKSRSSNFFFQRTAGKYQCQLKDITHCTYLDTSKISSWNIF